MRLITIKAPAGDSLAISQKAFSAGISHVSVQQAEVQGPNEVKAVYDVLEIETATPLAKRFIEELTLSPLYDPKSWIISIRHPRSLLTQESPAEETFPVITPSLDIYEDLWQFSHITVSLTIRVLSAALLLAYGLIKANIPIMIAGLLFLPFHHQMLAMAFGTTTGKWRLAAQGFCAFLLSTGLIVAGGATVALFEKPPIAFDHFGTLLSGFFIALCIGIAAAIASADDAGRRELIGLAATAHITTLPAWFGISLVFGFPEKSVTFERAAAFGINVSTVIVSAGIVYLLLRLRLPALSQRQP